MLEAKSGGSPTEAKVGSSTDTKSASPLSGSRSERKGSIWSPLAFGGKSTHEILQAQQGDWSTLDWMNSQAEAMDNAAHHSRIRRGLFKESYIRRINESFFSALISGALLGVIGVFADACSRWVSSLRMGICVNYFWLVPDLCCVNQQECEQYYTWGEFFLGQGDRVTTFISLCAYVCISVLAAVTSSFLCKMYAPYAAGGGINEVKTIISGHRVRRYLGQWTMVTKIICMTYSTGSGLVVGKEGPFVHIGACVGGLVANLFPSYRLEAKKRELIIAGAAGGLAVAFGAPIGGVIFSLEELSSFYNFKAMMSALICGVTAVLIQSRVDLWHTGQIVQFSVNYRHSWHFFELPAFALLGAFAGLAGSLFNVANTHVIRWRKKRFLKWRIAEVATVAAITAFINFFIPFGKGGLLDLLANTFRDCTPNSDMEICQYSDVATLCYLLLCGCVKFALFIYTIGIFVPAGNLVPSLTIGALFGRAYGISFRALQEHNPTSFFFMECYQQEICIVPAAYAIVGAAGLLTGVTRMTICLVIIMFELTGSLEYMVPVIVGILCAKAAAEAIGVEGLYEIGIAENNLPFLDPKKEFHYDAVASEIYANRSFTVLTAYGFSVGSLGNLLAKLHVTGFPLVSTLQEKTLLGYVHTKKLLMALEEATIRDPNITTETKVCFGSEKIEGYLDLSHIVTSSVLQVEPECPVNRVLYLFKCVGTQHIMVTTHSRFQGFITKKDLLKFMRTVEKEELAEEDMLEREDPASHP